MSKPPNIESAATIGAETFLEEVASGTFGRRLDWQAVLVDGTVNLRRHPLRERITTLPAVSIMGDLIADSGCALRVCRARVLGMVALDGSHIEDISPVPSSKTSLVGVGGKLSAKGCANLRKISGTFQNDVSLDGSGIGEVLSDFRCDGVFSVEGCGNLRKLDCTATSVIADGSALEETGPNAAIENFSAEGCLNLAKATPIRGLKWAKYDGSGVEEVHPRFACKGPAYFKRCRNLSSLSGSAASFEVSMAPLAHIGGLTSGGAIIFTDCRNLPPAMRGLRSKTLVFARCGLKELPAGIHPDTDVRISQCPRFSRLPARWKGEISLAELPSLIETPSGFRCLGKFSTEACENLSRIAGFVGGDLHLMADLPRLKSLGSDLEIGGSLWVSPRAGLLSVGCRVCGSLTAKAGYLRETTAELDVGGDADFHGNQELRALRGRFGGKVVLDETSVETLGADLEVGGNLSASKTPELVLLNCVVNGHVLVKDSGLRRTGPAFQCGKSVSIRNCPNFDSLQGEVGGPRRFGRPRRVASRTADKLGTSAPMPLSAPQTRDLRPPNRVYPNKWFVPRGQSGEL